MADSSTLSVVDEVVVERVAREMARRYGDGYNLDHLGTGERNRFLHEARLALTAAGLAQPAANLVPGVMRCAKCAFQLHRNTMYLGSGTIGPGDSKTELCPNGCGPLWPVTWQQWATEGWEYAEKLHCQIQAALPEAGVAERWRKQLLQEFPLLDDDGLSDMEHHCEWTLQQDRKRLHAMLAAAPQPEARAAECAKSIMARAIEISDAHRMSGEPRNLSIVTLRMDDADTVLSELQSEPAGRDSLMGWANPIDIEKARRHRGKRKGSAIAVFVSAEQSDTYLVPLYASAQPKGEAEPIDGSGMTHGAWLAAQPDPAGNVPPRPLAIAQGLIDHAPGVGGEAGTFMLLAAAAIKAMAAESRFRAALSPMGSDTGSPA